MKIVTSALFLVVIVFLTRQVPLVQYSVIMNVALLLFMIFNIGYIYTNVKSSNWLMSNVIFSLLVLMLLFLYSLYLGNDLSLIVRFYFILNLILFAYLVEPSKFYVQVFLLFSFVQAFFVIFLELYLVLFFDLESYSHIRQYFLNNNWGDVYSFDGDLWKIQLRGNALLPFALFVVLINYSGVKKYSLSFIFGSAVLCAGNFAFILGIVFFLVLYYLYSKSWSLDKIVVRSIFSLLIIASLILPVSEYFFQVVESKAEKSNQVRLDQVEVLIENMDFDAGSLLLGRGLGNTIDRVTEWRNYTGNVYYELQSLYIMNQVGVLFFTYFLLLNLVLSIYFFRYKLLLIAYFSYVFYSLFNPYIFDTNHVIVIIILLSLRCALNEQSLFSARNLQPSY